jgi:hypothetical protein
VIRNLEIFPVNFITKSFFRETTSVRNDKGHVIVQAVIQSQCGQSGTYDERRCGVGFLLANYYSTNAPSSPLSSSITAGLPLPLQASKNE